MRKNTFGGKRLFTVWANMKQRCYNPKATSYHSYGGRGIGMPVWKDDYRAFQTWAELTGYDEFAPKGQCTIDRLDNDGDYTPENCRWVSMKEQARHRRPCEDTLRIQSMTHWEIGGITKTAVRWCKDYGVDYNLTMNRVIHLGKSPIDALTADLKVGRPSKYGCDEMECDGEVHTAREWSEMLGMSINTLYARKSRGWTDEGTLKTPVRIRSAPMSQLQV